MTTQAIDTTGNQALTDSLAKITGTVHPTATQVEKAGLQMQANYPAFVTQKTAELGQKAEIPAMVGQTSDEAKMYAMWANDKNLAQQYTSTQPQPTDIPTYGKVGTPETPELTSQSLAAGFQGFQTPGPVTKSITAEGDRFQSAIDLINKAITYQADEVTKQATSSGDAYKAMADALVSLAGYMQKSSTADNTKEAQTNSAKQDAEKGMDLRSLQVKYQGKLTADEIFQVYNLYNYGPETTDASGKPVFNAAKGGWGTYKQTPSELQQQFGVTTSAIPKAPATVTPITSTTKGKTTTTGWKVKFGSGSTKTIYPASANVGIGPLGWGASPSKTAGQDPQQIVNDYEAAGATDDQIIERLQSLGFTVQ